MSIFKQTLHTLHTLEREREPSRFARAQRLHSLLEQDLRFANLPNFTSKLAALSPVPLETKTALPQLPVKGPKVGPKAALIAAALSSFTASDFSDPAKRANFRVLRRLSIQDLERPATRGGQKNVTPPGADRRRYNPTGKDFAVTMSGNVARLVGNPLASSWMQVFRNPRAVVPCLQRKSRREVMFAQRTAGKGYKVKHRRTWSSGVPC